MTEYDKTNGHPVIPLPEDVLHVLNQDFQFNHVENLFESLYSKYGSDVFMVMNNYLTHDAPQGSTQAPEVYLADAFNWHDTGLGADKKIDETLNYKVQGEDRRDEAGFDNAHNAMQYWDKYDPAQHGPDSHGQDHQDAHTAGEHLLHPLGTDTHAPDTIAFDPISHVDGVTMEHSYTVHGAVPPTVFDLHSFEQAAQVDGAHVTHTLDGLIPSDTSVSTQLQETVEQHLPPEHLEHGHTHHMVDGTAAQTDPGSVVMPHEAEHVATGHDAAALMTTEHHHKTE